jgi:hypothetical protein
MHFPALSTTFVFRVAVAATACAALLGGCGSATEQGVIPVQTTSTPTAAASGAGDPSASTSPSTDVPATKTDFRSHGDASLGLVMTKPADAKNLTGTSTDFIAYMTAAITSNQAAEANCQESVTTNVTVFDPAGWAAGSVTGCDNARVIWGKSDLSWEQIWRGSDLPACAELRALKVPADIVAAAVESAECLESGRIVAYAG